MNVRRIVAAAAVAVGMVAVPATAAHAGPNSPGCVSRTEYAANHGTGTQYAPHAWSRKHTNQRYGVRGELESEYRTSGFRLEMWQSRLYPACWRRANGGAVTVVVEFMKIDYSVCRAWGVDCDWPQADRPRGFNVRDVYTF